MTFFVSKTGVWDVIAGEVNTPELSLRGVTSSAAIKVTCQFFARTMSDDLNDGFEYAIEPLDELPVGILTPNVGIVQGSDSWQLYTHVVLYEVLATSAQSEALDVSFNISVAKQSMNGRGFMMNYTMLAELTRIEN